MSDKLQAALKAVLRNQRQFSKSAFLANPKFAGPPPMDPAAGGAPPPGGAPPMAGPPPQGGPMPPGGGAPPGGGQVDPQTGLPIDPNSGLPMDPQTGLLVDLQNGVLIDPASGQMIDPQTMQPIDPAAMQGGGAPPPGGDPAMAGPPPGGDPSMGPPPPGGDPAMAGPPPGDPAAGAPPMDPAAIQEMVTKAVQDAMAAQSAGTVDAGAGLAAKTKKPDKMQAMVDQLQASQTNMMKILTLALQKAGIEIPLSDLMAMDGSIPGGQLSQGISEQMSAAGPSGSTDSAKMAWYDFVENSEKTVQNLKRLDQAKKNIKKASLGGQLEPQFNAVLKEDSYLKGLFR